MKQCHRRPLFPLIAAAVLLLAGTALAAGPVWMPGFPMRMGPNVMLMWAPVPGAASYNLYRSTAKGELGPKLAAAPMNNHMDANVPLDKDAVYTVKAVMADGTEGDASAQGILAGVKPLDPPKFTGHLFSNGQLSLRWDRVDGAAFYNILKAEDKAGPFALAGSVQETKYVDTKVEEGKSYYYQASAVDKNNVESPKSVAYEVVIEKPKVAEQAKIWPLAEKMIKYEGRLYGPDEEPLKAPGFMATDGSVLYVSEAPFISAISLTGERLAKFVAPPKYDGTWGYPQGVGVSPDGQIVAVTWKSSAKVRLFNPRGELLSEFNIQKPTQAEYAPYKREADWEEDKALEPLGGGILVDPKGQVWVAEAAWKQVHIYTQDGQLVKKFGEPRARTYELKDMGNLTVLRFDKASNRVYGLDPTRKTVRAFDADTMDFIRDDGGKPIWGWTRSGPGPGQVQLPKGIALEGDDLYMVDGIDNRVHSYDRQMEYRNTLVTKEGVKAPERLENAVDILVIGPKVYVSEMLSDRITVYAR